jgi:hypothetical protein
MAHNKKGKQPLQGQGWNHAQIDRRNRVRMQELRSVTRSPRRSPQAGRAAQ